MPTLPPERYTGEFCMVAKVTMGTQQDHVKILFFKMAYVVIK